MVEKRMLCFTISALLLIFVILTTIIVSTGFEEEYGEGLCVDGDGDINLEGIMCEKEITTFFGYSVDSTEASVLQLIFALLFIVSFFGFMVFFLMGVTEEN